MEKIDLKRCVNQTGLTVVEVNVSDLSDEEVGRLRVSIDVYLKHLCDQRDSLPFGRTEKPQEMTWVGGITDKMWQRNKGRHISRLDSYPIIRIWCAIEDANMIQGAIEDGSIFKYFSEDLFNLHGRCGDYL